MDTESRNRADELRVLLEEYRPPGGVVYLLAEHWVPNLYFPVLPITDVPYWALPYDLSAGLHPLGFLRGTTSLYHWLQRARIEACLELDEFYQVIDTIGCTRETTPRRLCLVRSSPEAAIEPLDDQKRKVQYFKNLLTKQYELCEVDADKLYPSTFSDYPDESHLYDHLLSILSDERQGPPFFPILRAVIKPLRSTSTPLHLFNFLTMNCHFRRQINDSTTPYLKPMLENFTRYNSPLSPTSPPQAPEQCLAWWEDLHLFYNSLPEKDKVPEAMIKYSARTIDLVRPVGVFLSPAGNDAWHFFARHNFIKNEQDQLHGGPDYHRASDSINPVSVFDKPSAALRNVLQNTADVSSERKDFLISIWAIPENAKPSLLVTFMEGITSITDESAGALCGLHGGRLFALPRFNNFEMSAQPLNDEDKTVCEKMLTKYVRPIDQALSLLYPVDRIVSELEQGTVRWFANAPVPHGHSSSWTREQVEAYKEEIRRVFPFIPSSWFNEAEVRADLHRCLKSICGDCSCWMCPGAADYTIGEHNVNLGGAYLLLLKLLWSQNERWFLDQKSKVLNPALLSAVPFLQPQSKRVAFESVKALLCVYYSLCCEDNEGSLEIESLQLVEGGRGFKIYLTWDAMKSRGNSPSMVRSAAKTINKAVNSRSLSWKKPEYRSVDALLAFHIASTGSVEGFGGAARVYVAENVLHVLGA